MQSRSSSKPTHEEDIEEEWPVVCPISQCLNSSTLTFTILGLIELETTITECETLDYLNKVLIPACPLFSSIIVTDKEGVKRWKKVDVQAENHLIIPTFPTGLEIESYDQLLREYVSKIGNERFSREKPLWECHLFKYPSANGVGSFVFKLGHAIGDGYAYMKILSMIVKRAENPHLPLTYPNLSLRQRRNDQVGRMSNFLGSFVKCINTVSDIIYNTLKTTVMVDCPSAIRSGKWKKKELFKPIDIYSIKLSLKRVREVKSKLGSTMNDVITGIISYVIHLYMAKMGQNSTKAASSMTMLVMLNMRVLKNNYKDIDDMMKSADTWGNHSRFFPVKIPSIAGGENINPLDFITKAKEHMDRSKNSMIFYLLDPLLDGVRSIFGQKGMEQVVRLGFKNASTLITSLVGPKEQISIADRPIGNFYFIVAGIPQSLTFTSMSCMEQLQLVATMEKGFIDSNLFASCMDEAFENIFQAAFGNEAKKSA
ncbi:hypothetical protein MKW94_021390 [Papaver nudicaule]|uniref:Diacylglycerol O-acyltransferase n=1 Tax=Papaver nudicaule TaxID=74823 RepID=A0AA41RZJ1_PAPNU|nr:hypothetical protein [Papaver nudicaule]